MVTKKTEFRGAFVVTEAGCMDPTTGSWRHILIGVQELSKHFEIRTVFPEVLSRRSTRKPNAPRRFGELGDSLAFGALRDLRAFAVNCRATFKALKAILRLKPDFCYCRLAFLDPLPVVLKLLHICPVFIEANGFQFDRAAYVRSPFKWLHKVFEKWTYERADYTFFVGTQGDYWQLPKNNWSNTEEGVEEEFLKLFAEHRKDVGSRVNICLIARLMRHHSPELLVTAVKMLCNEERERVHLHLFGIGFEGIKSELKGTIEITDHGFKERSQLAIKLREMHVGLIMAAPEYASHMKLFDYGAAKLVAIVPATHNLKYWFKDSEVAFFDPGDLQMFCKQLTAVIKDGDTAGRGQALHMRIRRDFLWETVYGEIATIIARRCKANHRGDG